MPAQRAPQDEIVESLDALHAILRLVAGGGTANGEGAVQYLNHRSHLLNSRLGQLLPGFLYQCVTLDRFKEFIFLYDPDVVLRHQFIDRMIERCRAFCLTERAARAEEPPRSHSDWDF